MEEEDQKQINTEKGNEGTRIINQSKNFDSNTSLTEIYKHTFFKQNLIHTLNKIKKPLSEGKKTLTIGILRVIRDGDFAGRPRRLPGLHCPRLRPGIVLCSRLLPEFQVGSRLLP